MDALSAALKQSLEKFVLPNLTALREMNAPIITAWQPTKYEKSKLRHADVLDTKNLTMGQVLYRHMVVSRAKSTWHSFDLEDVQKVFGSPTQTFWNYGERYGMWWFRVQGCPLLPARTHTFNICAGPDGLRAGLLHPDDSPIDFYEAQATHQLAVCWFHLWVWQCLDTDVDPALVVPAWKRV